MGDNFGIHRTPSRGPGLVLDGPIGSTGQVLSDFLVQLEDYTPTVRNIYLS